MTNKKVIQTNRIYHYCRLSTAIEHILDKKRLLLAPLTNTNDPRENKSFVFAATYFPDDNPGDLLKSSEKISNYLRQDCKLLCFSLDSYYLSGFEYSRMWANYGDRHKGICLELGKNEFIEENKDYIDAKHFKKVKYKAYNPYTYNDKKTVDYTSLNKLGEEKYLKSKFRKKYLDYLYFTKTKEWESEKELRLVSFSDKKENEYVDIKNSLKKIYLGVDFNEKYLPAIKALTKELEISRLIYYEGRMSPRTIKNM